MRVVSSRSQAAIIALLVYCAVAAPTNGTVPSQRCDKSCHPLVCNTTSGTCRACVSDGECTGHHTRCHNGRCRKESVSESFDMVALAAVAGALGVCGIAAVAGVGGGGILVPMYSAALGISIGDAVALSQATITGQSLISVMLKLRRPHQTQSRPLINWTLMTFWLPCSLAGTAIGNLVGKMVPDWFRIVLLLVLLSYVLARVISRAIRQRQKDGEERAVREAEAATTEPSITAVPVSHSTDSTSAPATQVGVNAVTSTKEPPSTNDDVSVTSASASESASAGLLGKSPKASGDSKLRWVEVIPLTSAMLILATFVPLGVVNFIMSSKNGIVSCGSDTYWSLFSAIVAYNFAITGGVRAHLRRVFRAVLELDDVAGEEAEQMLPFRWNRKTSLIYPVVAVVAGGAASLLGIGGGLILGALFLEAGLSPEEVSATSGATTLLVAAESFAQYVIQGTVAYEYAGLFVGTGVVGAVLGYFLQREIKRRQASYLIVVCLAIIMGGSMLATAADGIYATYYDWKHHKQLGFRGACHSK